MIKNRINLFFILVFVQYLAANFAHPITPTLIKELRLPDYMFGLAFAAMSFTLFLFSPFWGKMREFFSVKHLLLIGCSGYGVGQYLFSIASSEWGIVVARCVSGFFVGAIGVSTLIYITEKSPKERIGEYLARLAIIQALGSSFGYFIGGSVGVYSISLTFGLQVATLVTCGLLFFYVLEDTSKKDMKQNEWKTLAREMNPLKSFLHCKDLLHRNLVLVLFVICAVTIASNAFDQSFNYYLKAEFNFSSFYNGALKAINGIVTLLVVGTVCMWIIKRRKIIQYTSFILFFSAVGVIGVMSFHQQVIFLGLAIFFYSLNAMINPLLQDLVVMEGGEGKRNMLMGLYNSVKSLGMILGALFAGFLYQYGPNVPFLLSAGGFSLTGFIMVRFFFIKQKKVTS